MRVGFVTIGQSPRDDILGDLPEALRNIHPVQVGALDNLDPLQIEAMQPVGSETVYVSRLRDGLEVSIAKEKLIPLLEEKIELLHKDVNAIVILCSGSMTLRNSSEVIFPSKLLRETVESMLAEKHRVGVIIPEESQTQLARDEWNELDEIEVVNFSPYSEPVEHLADCSKKLKDRDLIVMDCIGYSSNHASVVRNMTGKPVITAREVTFQFLEKLITNTPGQKIQPSPA